MVRGQETDLERLNMLRLFAELASETKNAKVRDKIVKRLSQTAQRIVRPKFDHKRLRDALIAACVEKPDFEDPVVLDAGKRQTVLHLSGSFDLDILSSKYFEPTRETIDAE
jgi:hypothetical protein